MKVLTIEFMEFHKLYFELCKGNLILPSSITDLDVDFFLL